MQGTPLTNFARTAGTVLDLNAVLAQRALHPVAVQLGEASFTVNRDLTGREAAAFVAYMNTGQDEPAFTLLVGTREERAALMAARDAQLAGDSSVTLPIAPAAVDLNAQLDALPRLHMSLASAHLMRASVALSEFAASDADLYARYGYEVPDEVPQDDAAEGDSGKS